MSLSLLVFANFAIMVMKWETYETKIFSKFFILCSGASLGVFYISNEYETFTFPQFWLGLLAGFGLLLVPVYFVKCLFAITIEPECYYSSRKEPLRFY